jgi:hypothetical protein
MDINNLVAGQSVWFRGCVYIIYGIDTYNNTVDLKLSRRYGNSTELVRGIALEQITLCEGE